MAAFINKPLYIVNVGYSENKHIYTHIHSYIQSDEIVQHPAVPTPKKKKKPTSRKEIPLISHRLTLQSELSRARAKMSDVNDGVSPRCMAEGKTPS